MFPEIRPYQQDIINKTLETTKSTLIQLPTGGGKTIISKEIGIDKLIDECKHFADWIEKIKNIG